MKFIRLITLVAVFCLQISCTDSHEEVKEADYIYYAKENLSLEYPADWQLTLDDSPGLYSSRAVAFAVSDVSTATINIVNRKEVSTYHAEDLNSYAEYIYNSLGIDGDTHSKNIHREKVSFENKPGEKITWTDNLIGESNFQVFVVEVKKTTPKIYVLINLSDEDIATNVNKIQRFISSVNTTN